MKKTSDITNNVILLLPLHFTKNICCCRFAFAQKTFAAQAAHWTPPAATEINPFMEMSHKLFYFAFKHQLFRGKNYRQ
ncbi:hypothetical protein P4562_04105 [Lysinibacillus xylanilyticus]|uniref:hypothetical protein n=1 Tax=Lysinibacillus xylanilyticus TaxID=582475 RepID=UPI002E249EF4|nr:hypothetical protein [Lysinibacillus xylanilyticus]